MTREQWERARNVGRDAWVRRRLIIPLAIGAAWAAFKFYEDGTGGSFWRDVIGLGTVILAVIPLSYGRYDHSERRYERTTSS